MNARSKRLLIAAAAIVVIAAPVALFAWKVYERNAQEWVPGYLLALANGSHVSSTIDQAQDLVFVFVDHHEHPLKEPEAQQSAESWARDYRKNIAGITDDYGRPFQYSWFYPYDGARTPSALLTVNRMVFEGLGEIDFHWHNNEVPNAAFEENLHRGIDWFHSVGAMREFGPSGKTAFGYIAGNWALDNGLGKKSGPSRELEQLAKAGCYADFTLSNTSVAQSSMYSSIYFAVDDDRPKSYDTGVPARVGERGKGLMIFQGPSAVDMRDRTLEIGSVEAWYGSDWHHRISIWFDNAPYVSGRPEWRFIKVYTHGVQSRSLILGEKFHRMLVALKDFSREKKVRLHFVTAREAYNMVRAAEDGKSGDPNQYLDYEIAPPVNRFVNINRQARDIAASDTRLIIDGAEGGGASSVTATRGPVVAVDGDFERFEAIDDSGKLKVQISGTQPVSIVARAPIDAMQGLQPAECASDRARGSHCYTWIPGAASAAVANRR